MILIIISDLSRSKCLEKWPGRVENLRTNRDHPICSIVKISHNANKIPGILRRFADTQIPEKRPSNKVV